MTTVLNAPSTGQILNRIAPLRLKLAAHPLYANIQTAEHVRTFMESNVFAVWDFMSLLKALQLRLTCVELPWRPTAWPESRRFINEIVLGEESDLYQGRAISHFELYLEAMREVGAATEPTERLLKALSHRPTSHPADLLQDTAIPAPARAFVTSTFKAIESAGIHAIAAAFTFGREDVIPDIFSNLVRELDRKYHGKFEKFLWYLERHIEVDGEDHGPLSLRMVADICGDNSKLWEEAASAAEAALLARIALWDGILALL